MTGCGSDDDENKLIVGIDDQFPPLSFRNEKNELTGFDVELAKETFKRMGVKAEFKPIDWNKKEEEITTGGVDMIWSGLDINDKRKGYMIFTKPYMDDRQILLIREDSSLTFYSEDDLEGKIVGMQAGSSSTDYINQNAELKNRLKDCKTYLRFGELLEALGSGEIEVIVCDELIARYEMNAYPDSFRVVEVKIGEIAETGIGFAKNNAKLRDKVQAAFDEVIKDGTAQEISAKWFNADLIKSR